MVTIISLAKRINLHPPSDWNPTHIQSMKIIFYSTTSSDVIFKYEVCNLCAISVTKKKRKKLKLSACNTCPSFQIYIYIHFWSKRWKTSHNCITFCSNVLQFYNMPFFGYHPTIWEHLIQQLAADATLVCVHYLTVLCNHVNVLSVCEVLNDFSMAHQCNMDQSCK